MRLNEILGNKRIQNKFAFQIVDVITVQKSRIKRYEAEGFSLMQDCDVVTFFCHQCGKVMIEYWCENDVLNCNKQPIKVDQERICDDCMNAIAFDETRIAEHLVESGAGDGEPCLRWDCVDYNGLMDIRDKIYNGVDEEKCPVRCLSCFFRLGYDYTSMNYRWRSFEGKDCHEHEAITLKDDHGEYRICPECRHHHRLSVAKEHEMMEKGFHGYHDCKNLILSNEKGEDGMYKVIAQCNCWAIEHGERVRY